MARKKSGGEGGGNAVLVIFLVFFALVAIALGVMYWTGQEKVAAADAREKEAARSIADKAVAQEQAEAKYKLLKVFVGIGTADDKKDVQAASSDPAKSDALRTEYRKLMEAARDNLAASVGEIKKEPGGIELERLGYTYDLKANEVITWDWPEGKPLPLQPSPGHLLDRVARVVAEKERAQRSTVVRVKNANTEAAAYTAERKKYADALTALNAKVDEQIKALDKAIAAVEAEKKASIEKFATASDETRKEVAKRQAQVDEAKTEMVATRETLKNVSDQLQTELSRRNAEEMEKKGAFTVNLPHARILTRKTGTRTVTIDIGSAAGLRPNQTFTIQPASTRTEGLSRRRKQEYVNGNLVVSDEIASKGTLEVVSVEGANLSVARITAEEDENRDPILVGDLLYNPLFKKNAKDHIVLVGIFDTNGDGIDDIADVARDLSKRGAIVDGYFDLSSNKWESLDPNVTKPGPGANITYAVRGWEIDTQTADPLNNAKGVLRTQIGNALAEAREKGAQEIRAAKFLSEIGYPLSGGINDQTVTSAAIRYLKEATPVAPPPMPK